MSSVKRNHLKKIFFLGKRMAATGKILVRCSILNRKTQVSEVMVYHIRLRVC